MTNYNLSRSYKVTLQQMIDAAAEGKLEYFEDIDKKWYSVTESEFLNAFFSLTQKLQWRIRE